ncbi:MAG: B12-binding domain-containing radical SAM protein [Thaumarchaeota archaeon]|nr:B12-binding domain-containing radical SAM protein [Nitrososphaerota archaeon]
MAKYVLISDLTLSHDYQNFPLLDFLPSAPTDNLPNFIYKYLKGKPPPDINGRASMATYPLRKLEAALLQKYPENDVVVAHEDHFEKFIKDDTEIIGVTTMDPLGLAPLTMSYTLFFGSTAPAYVRKEFESLLARINRIREGKKAKLIIGGPGVWEFTVQPQEMDNLNIDYAFQGESEDIITDLFDYVLDDSTRSSEFFKGFQTFDSDYHKSFVNDPRFISRYQFSKQFPKLEDIPEIVNPTIKGFLEVMRGCGIGCDFCEVTLRSLRYYPPEKVLREIAVNVKKGGLDNVWTHSDEIFAYNHGKNFVPDTEALIELFKAIMGAPGITHTNPTHGRISIPVGYPDLIRKLSEVMKAGPDNWIGLQVGVETGSNKLAKLHMPNKTLPLKIGPDGTWPEIVWQGTYVMNKYYWRPAFTVQVGQESETEEDNWDTVALINQMSNSEVDGRPFEFTITPMQNVSLGHLRSRDFSMFALNESQLAVYYVSYKHLAKVAARDAFQNGRNGRNRNVFSLLGAGALISLGGKVMLRSIANMCRKQGLNLEKAAAYGLDRKVPQAPSIPAM